MFKRAVTFSLFLVLMQPSADANKNVAFNVHFCIYVQFLVRSRTRSSSFTFLLKRETFADTIYIVLNCYDRYIVKLFFF